MRNSREMEFQISKIYCIDAVDAYGRDDGGRVAPYDGEALNGPPLGDGLDAGVDVVLA